MSAKERRHEDAPKKIDERVISEERLFWTQTRESEESFAPAQERVQDADRHPEITSDVALERDDARNRLLCAISDSEFADIVSLCQFMPGPNIVGIAVCVGARMRGAIGTIAALCGFLVIPWAIGLSLGLLCLEYAHLPILRNILGGIAATAAGLLIATGIRRFRSVCNQLRTACPTRAEAREETSMDDRRGRE